MKVRKEPLRSCVVTREKLPKGELIRVVRTPLGDVVIDLTGKQNGRGAYIKKSIDVVKKAEKKNALGRHLGVPIPDCLYDELIKVIGEE